MFEEKTFEPSAWDREHNPLFVQWREEHVPLFAPVVMGEFQGPPGKTPLTEFRCRTACIEKYGFAIPTEAALREIIEVSPKGIVEIGAGTGYWTALLRKLGADVLACDDASGMYTFKVGTHAEVQKADYKSFFQTEKSCKERTLLTVWPSYDNKEIFSSYKGDTVVYVGELGDGCTGYDPDIEKKWEMVKEVEIPVWSCIHDSMGIFKRK